MKLQKIAVLALTLSAALSACAQQTAPAAPETASAAIEETTEEAVTEKAESVTTEESTGAETETSPEETVSEEETTAAEETADVSEEVDPCAVYADMDGIIFGFMSGVGAWETTLQVAEDGSFQGLFYDMNMGETGEGFDNGTLYECEFTGRFSVPEKKDDLTWTAEVSELDFKTEKDGSDRYIDEDHVLHILTDPYGLSLGDSIEILLPGTAYEDLTEGFLSWMVWQIEEGEALPEIAIYNTSGEYVFYPDHYAMGDVSFDTEYETEPAEEPETSTIYDAAVNAYANQTMPDYFLMPYVPLETYTPAKPYQSVTEANLQGRWVNRYKEGGSQIEEILSVNGSRGKIECYRDGQPTYAWNGEGTISIEDRSDRNLCPAFRISNDEEGNICTIYVRWVKDNSFYDGGFLNQWKRETPDDPAEQYRYDSVTLDNLQGLWYSEYEDSAGLYMTLLNIDGDRGWIFETVDGRISDVWNGEGPVSLVLENFMGDIWYPELLLKREDGPAAGGTAGVYITDVEEDRFYDAGFNRWYIKIGTDYGADMEYLFEPGVELFEDGSALYEGKNTYLITPDGELEEDGGCLSWTIRITTADGTEETISHQVDDATIHVPSAYEVLSEVDVNFDDLPDLLLYRGTLGATGIQHYDCYLNHGDSFVFCEGFRDIPDPDPDAASRQIDGHARDGAAAYYDLTYTIRGNTAVLIDEVRYEYDENLQDYVPKN